MCSSTRVDCSKDSNYTGLDSLLSNNNMESANIAFYNPDFNKKFIQRMCQNAGEFHAITLLKQRRKMIFYTI